MASNKERLNLPEQLMDPSVDRVEPGEQENAVAELMLGLHDRLRADRRREPALMSMATTPTVALLTRASPADALELLIVSEAPRQIRIGRQVMEEHLGELAFRLLKFLCVHKGGWYTTDYLIGFLWPDADRSPLQADQALARRKKRINDLISPYFSGENAIGSYPNRGYRLRPRLEE